MLEITIPARELWDERNEVFINLPEETLTLEHSLISVSKWEAKTHIPFMSKDKTKEEIIEYIKCMSIKKIQNEEVLKYLPADVIEKIAKYIDDTMTATWINEDVSKSGVNSKGKVITSEVIYAWMIGLNIPIEFEKWHFRRLLTLIRVVEEETQPKKKMSQQEWAAKRAAINAERKARLNSSG